MTGRYAPSPTGPLHLGNLRTALLAWLFARSAGSAFLLRIEDLDTGRIRPEHETGQLADLLALGLDWDGDVVRQSERDRLYAAAIERLDTYPCYCTRAEIREAASAPHGERPEGAYPGTCRDLDRAARAERERAGRPPALRLRADGTVDDFVVRRNDGAFAYNLAVVVDDADQGIEEVVRGADLLETTPRQVWLARRLGLPVPHHVHVPLVLGPDGSRLAKRHGAVTLADRAALGEDAAAVRAMLAASLGLVAPGERPDASDLVERFDPAELPTEPDARAVTAFVRIWLPVIVVVGGVLAIALGPDDYRWEGGLGIVGAGVAIWLINLLFRIGASGDREREDEDRAREYFDRHGHWPGE